MIKTIILDILATVLIIYILTACLSVPLHIFTDMGYAPVLLLSCWASSLIVGGITLYKYSKGRNK